MIKADLKQTKDTYLKNTNQWLNVTQEECPIPVPLC